MRHIIEYAVGFWKEEHGQDLVEYTLLMGFVALAAAALFPTVAGNIRTIWNVVSNHLVNAASAAVKT